MKAVSESPNKQLNRVESWIVLQAAAVKVEPGSQLKAYHFSG